MLKTLGFLLLIAFVSCARALFAEGHIAGYEDSLPNDMYSWVSPAKLEEMGKQLEQDSTQLPLLPMKQANDPWVSKLIVAIPALAGRRGMYVWKNPVTAAVGGLKEDYGTRLIKMRPVRRKLNVVVLYTPAKDNMISNADNIDWSTVDAIHHYHSGKTTFEEYIILKPAVIKSFTADPQKIAPDLRKELRHLNDKDYFYPESELYLKTTRKYDDIWHPLANQFGYRSMLFLPKIEAYVKLTTKDIPSAWANLVCRGNLSRVARRKRK